MTVLRRPGKPELALLCHVRIHIKLLSANVHQKDFSLAGMRK